MENLLEELNTTTESINVLKEIGNLKQYQKERLKFLKEDLIRIKVNLIKLKLLKSNVLLNGNNKYLNGIKVKSIMLVKENKKTVTLLVNNLIKVNKKVEEYDKLIHLWLNDFII